MTRARGRGISLTLLIRAKLSFNANTFIRMLKSNYLVSSNISLSSPHHTSQHLTLKVAVAVNSASLCVCIFIMFWSKPLVLFLAFPAASALTFPSYGRASRRSCQLNERTKESRRSSSDSPKKKKRCSRCPESNDMDMDRREAAFAMLGSLWAMSTTAITPETANAAYGADANMEFPNVVEGISRRTNEQCLVESLGSRQCLVYLDPANKLYQKPDTQVLLERIEKASASLARIPNLVENKKWSQVNGVLTGPLGNLVLTMQQLSQLSENAKQATTLAKQVKADIIDIGQASDRKQGDKALASHQKATDDLVAFVKSL